METNVSKPNHLLRRGSVYYLRVRVPADLLDHFKPKKDIVRSLRTSDYQEASLKVRMESLGILKEFHDLRIAKKSKQTSITAEESKRLADLWLSHLLEEDEEVRMEGLSDRAFSKKVETQEIVEDALRRQLARGQWNLSLIHI